VGISDLIQVAIFFIFANWLKQIFYNKILKWKFLIQNPKNF
jgi:hypothetical protein